MTNILGLMQVAMDINNTNKNIKRDNMETVKKDIQKILITT